MCVPGDTGGRRVEEDGVGVDGRDGADALVDDGVADVDACVGMEGVALLNEGSFSGGLNGRGFWVGRYADACTPRRLIRISPPHHVDQDPVHNLTTDTLATSTTTSHPTHPLSPNTHINKYNHTRIRPPHHIHQHLVHALAGALVRVAQERQNAEEVDLWGWLLGRADGVLDAGWLGGVMGYIRIHACFGVCMSV